MISPAIHNNLYYTLFQSVGDYFSFSTKKKNAQTDDYNHPENEDNRDRRNKFPYTLRYSAIYMLVALGLLKALFAFNDATEKSLLATLKQKAYTGLTAEEHKDLCQLLAKFEGIHLSEAECAQAGNWYAAQHSPYTEAERKIRIDQLPLVNGQKIINATDIGTFVTTKSGFKVFIKENGFPDFTPFSVMNVQIEGMTGERYSDFIKANEAAGFGSKYDAHNKVHSGKFKDYTWHHHEDCKTMQLVPKSLNNFNDNGLSHTGGAAIAKHNRLFPDKKLVFPSPKIEK